MTGSEPYKEFDTTSIVSRDTVSVGKLTLRKRDIFLGGIAVIALIIAIILAIVLAVEAGRNSTSCQSPESAATGAMKGNNASGNTSDYGPCISPVCLKTAAYERSIMNETANPCDNFYQFACGGYASLYTPSPLIPNPSPFIQIQTENLQKMIYLLAFSPERDTEQSYERKLRHFMKSCNNHFDKMQTRGQPMLDQVIKPFGGWYVLDAQWDPSKFDLHKQLKIVHVDFWTPAFFALKLSTDYTDWNKKILEIDYGSLGLQYQDYIGLINGSMVHTLYSSYIKQLAEMFSRDANIQPNDTRISQFVNDVLEVEGKVAEFVYVSREQIDPHAPENRISLGTLSDLTSNTIDFVDYFKSQFPEVDYLLTRETGVAVLNEGFLHRVGPMLKNYTSTNEGKRKLHNYLVWTLINNYVDDLSWDYVHAKRQLVYSLYGFKDDTSGFRYCFNMADRIMRDAMGAVFVKNYVNMNDKQEATNILEKIKEEMFAAIRNFSWMTPDNKESAVTKIKDGLYKVGFPDFMLDESYMDSLYSIITIDVENYFGNVLSLNLASRKKFSDLIAKPNSRTLWVYPVYDAKVEYYNPWHELIATAGMFQNPLFAHNGPAYYNYGGIGTLLARNLIHAVDELGSYYKMDKSNVGNWWTNSTSQHYMDIYKCALDAQTETRIGPFLLSDGKYYTPNTTFLTYFNAPELLADASGLKLSFKAYKARMASIGAEKIPAGFPNYTANKMFFVAFAQAHCDNFQEITRLRNAVMAYVPPADFKVNLAVSQVQEFRETFGCKAGDRMAPAKTCTLF